MLLLLLLGGVAVALVMLSLVTLLTTNKTFVVIVQTVPLCFHPSGLGPLVLALWSWPSGLGPLACTVFVSMALHLGLRSSHLFSIMPLYRLLACSIVGLIHSLVPSSLVYHVEQCAGVMHYESELHLPFHFAANLECLYSR